MKTRADLTFKHNVRLGRHGWLRLTPAYSVKIVQEIIADLPHVRHVLDPFAGTGTTGLVCGETGLRCDLLDINPFLVWLMRVKTANYTSDERAEARRIARYIGDKLSAPGDDADPAWVPPIANIERWWSAERLALLARLRRKIYRALPEETRTRDLLLIAFCRSVIEWSNAAFNHQSMSFKQPVPLLFDCGERDRLLAEFGATVDRIAEAAAQHVSGEVTATHADARNVPPSDGGLYDAVITSPPYPNRMSYVRELRPYMYWLSYLNEAREAGELDWQAMGGTWGIATSRVAKWQPNGVKVSHEGFGEMIERISAHSPVLGNYVHKYFADAVTHLASLSRTLKPGAPIFYIVGNSKFYDIMVPVEDIFASLMRYTGFEEVRCEVLRKRSSKKELREVLVTAKKAIG